MKHNYCYYLAYQATPGVYSSEDQHVARCDTKKAAETFAGGRYYVVAVSNDAGTVVVYKNK